MTVDVISKMRSAKMVYPGRTIDDKYGDWIFEVDIFFFACVHPFLDLHRVDILVMAKQESSQLAGLFQSNAAMAECALLSMK